MAEEVVRNEPVAYGVVPGLRDVIRRISWGAVWSGLMVALGMEVLFTLFGFFIGFRMYHWQAANPWAGISAWTTIWYLVTAGWSMFFGAWCAAHLSGNPIAGDRILHGITTWGFATAVTIAIVGVASWAVLREGIDVLSTAAITARQVVPAAINHAAVPPGQVSQTAQQAAQAMGQIQANAGPVGQATATIISSLSLRIWGGVLLGLITAIIGGLVGSTRTVAVAPQDVVPVPTRRAA